MIKKLMMMFVAAFAAMGAWAATENIESYTDSNGVTWRYVRTNQDEAIIQGADYETLNSYLSIPDTIKGCKVTEVGDYAFAYCDELEFVYISKGVKKIGIGAFARCMGLLEVYLPDTLLTISSHAFFGCKYLDDIYLPEGLEYIGNQAFYDCYSLYTELRIPDSIKHIGNQAFANCISVYSLSIPEYLSFKDGVAVEYNIDNIFDSCTSMTKVSVRLGVGENSEFKTNGLSWCSSNNGLYLKNKKEDTLFHLAFCPGGLTSFTVDKSTITISENCFGAYSQLENIYVQSGNSVYAAKYGVLYSSDYKDLIFCPRRNGMVNGMAESVTNIMKQAIGQNDVISSVHISQNVKNIGSGNFGFCHNLQGFTVDENNQYYSAKDNFLCTKDGSAILSAPRTRTYLVIPGGTESVAMYASMGNDKTTKIRLPSGLKNIGGEAFGWCTELEEVNIPEGVTNIEVFAFWGCQNIKSISVPSSVNSIGGMAFSECSQLTDLIIENGVLEIDDSAFELCVSLESIEIPVSVTNIGGGAFGACERLKSARLPRTLKEIVEKNNVFEGCSKDLRINYYDVPLSILVAVAEESKGMGKVTGGKNLLAGTTATLKATANPGYLFSHWEGPLDSTVNRYSPSISFVALVSGTFTAHFIPVKDDVAAISFMMPKEYENGVAIDNVAIDVSGCTSLPTVKVAGLPAGLKFTAKPIYKKGSKTDVEVPANTIYGTPTKSGVYTIAATVTTAGKKTATCSQTVIFRKSGEKVVVAECDANGGKVTGGGVYAEGKSASLKATANKGYVFAGWYYSRTDVSAVQDMNAQAARSTSDAWAADFIPCDSTLVDYRNPNYSYVMGVEDKTFYARFEPIAADTNLNLMVGGVAITPADTPLKSFTIGSATNLPLVIDSFSLPKAAVKGLPAGMKFTEKPIFVKGSKTEIETPANSIYGTPTKPGVYKVSVSLTNTSIKKAIVNNFEIVVPNLKDGLVPVGDEYGPYVPGVAYTNAIVVAADCAVSGLPAGMKWTAKDILDNKTKQVAVPANSAYGVPTKPGKYTVYFTKTVDKVKHTATATFVVGDFPVVNVVTVGSGTGKVTGVGAFAANKKVTLKATADTKDDAKKGTKKSVFAGWYLDESCLSPVESTVDFRTASLPYVMTAAPETTLYALFVTAEEDSDIMLYVKDKEITANANDNNFVAEGTIILPLQMESISIPKATVSGLPAGMKYTDKALTVKATKTEEAYDVPANAIYGTPTKPGLYNVTVKLTNATIKKAIEKKFTIEVPNLTAADHLFRENGEYYIANDIGDKYSMYVGVTEFDLPKIRLNSSGTVKVSGLPAGLKYNAGTGAIEGIASKAGNYTVSLTVGGLVSTFTIEVKPLPNWVVGTFEGWGFDDPDFDGSRNIWTISKLGKVSVKSYCSDGNAIYQEPASSGQLTRFEDGCFVIYDYYQGSDRWGSYRGGGTYYICRSEVNGIEIGVAEGDYWGEEEESNGDYWEWEGKDYAVQNIWSKDTKLDFLPEIYNGAEKEIDLTGWSEKTFDKSNYLSEPLNRCSLRLKFGKNGAVTAAFYEPGASKATGTASATLMPYNRDGDTVEALLTIAIAPKGRHSITLALYLEIDTSRGIVYGDDIEVVKYLMEAE